MNNKLEGYVKIEDTGIESLLDSVELKCYDSILYLGGRVDDDNLYPPGYTKYLNQKIKELNPKKIICHSHWYAWKYYEKGILDESMKIDITVCNYGYLSTNTFDPINKHDYKGDHLWCIKGLIEKNPNIIFAAYKTQSETGIATSAVQTPSSVDFYMKWFKGCDPRYSINNLRYFTLDRRYNPLNLVNKDLGRRYTLCYGNHVRNSTDGFGVLTNILKLGFKKVNIIGFTAFGSDEDQSHFTPQGAGPYAGRKYFDLKTSENQRVEADILKYLAQNNKIKNLENYKKLMSCLPVPNARHVFWSREAGLHV